MKLIFLFIYIVQVLSFLDYQDQYQIRCKSIKTKDEEQIWKISIIHQIDRYSFVILCPISIIANLFVIVTFIKYKQTRKSPGQILMLISIFQMILATSWIIQGVQAFISNSKQTYPWYYHNYCYGIGLVMILAATGEFVYNCLFCIYLVYIIKNTLKRKKMPGRYIHLIGFGIIIAVLLFSILTQNAIGLSIFGTCSFKTNPLFPYAGIVLVAIYLFISFSTIIYFRKKVPNQQKFKKVKKQFLSYFFIYLAFNGIIWSVLAICYLVSIVNCQSKNPKSELQVLYTIGNISKLATPFLLCFIRYSHPTIKPRIWSFLNRCLASKQQVQQGLIQNEVMWLSNLAQSIKNSEIFCILVSIYMAIQRIDKKFNLDKMDLYQYMGTDNQQTLIQYQVTTLYLSSFKPKSHISQKQIIESLSFQSNKKKLQQISNEKEGKGGKSGQFFYFTGNQKLLIKTITKQQMNVLKQRQKELGNYWKNQSSLIVEIIGAFKFQIHREQFFLILMQNLIPTPKQNILKIYDLKGSTYNREVLTNKKLGALQTLKDTDFFKIQEKVFISQPQKQKVVQILIKDTDFLKSLKIIDYSLIIIKSKFQHGYKSTIQDQTWYQIGIIDFFQLWNFNKFAQRQAKKLLKLDIQLDTSSQQPQKYGQRFKALIKRIF